MSGPLSAHQRLLLRVAAVVVAGAAAVAVGVALLLGNTVALRDSSSATIRSSAYLLGVIDMERLVVNAETGLRGYVISDRTPFLAPLRAARQDFPLRVTALQRAAAAEHAYLGQSRQLIDASRSYLSGYVPRVAALMAAGDFRAARSFAITLTGKRLVDGIRARTQALEHLVSDRQAARERAARRLAARSVTEAIVVLVLLTLLTVTLGAFLGRLLFDRERARERSERTTRTLQQSILPEALDPIPRCELAVRFAPARVAELVGGDFYDVFAVESGHWAIVLGDVCGKGAEAAAVTAMARWTLRSLSGTLVTPAAALRLVNDVMLRQDLGGRFITIVYLLLSLEADHAKVSVACAGHPAPILVPAIGAPSTLDAHGDLLGVWPEIDLHSTELKLGGGDGIVLYTDGVTDQGPGPLRPPQLALLDRAPGASADQLAEALERFANQAPGTHRDDLAILALRFRGGAAVDGEAFSSPLHLNLAGRG